MIKTLYTLAVCTFIIMSVLTVFGQTGTLPGPEDKTKPDDKVIDGLSSIKFGINYLSNNVFMGRTDTVRTPVIMPELKYTFKSGIYFSGSLDYIPDKKKKKLDGGDFSAGYDLDITDDFSGGVSYTKLFYSSNSTQIASTISSTINVNFTYDFCDIISPTVGADYNINKQGIGRDVIVNAELTHDFNIKGVLGEEDILLISPTATLNAGSQNFYDAYLVKKKVNGTKKTAAQNALLIKYTNQLGQFQLLDYEISTPVEYKTGHFIFQFIPTYAIVKNQIPAAVSARISDQPSIFYYQLAVSLKF